MYGCGHSGLYVTAHSSQTAVCRRALSLEHVACAAAGIGLLPRSGWPAGLPSALHIAQEGVEMAVTMGMQLPPLNAPLVLQRFIAELGMPQVGWAVVLRLRQRPEAHCRTDLCC